MFVNGNEEMPDTFEQYCLRWNNHRSNLLLVFEHLFHTESFTDVTLACDGTSIKCHKMVLAACSSYFQTLFIENECHHPIVIMKDIKFSEIKAILEYMYRGEVNVAQDELAGLLKAAETLRVKGLVDDSPHLSQSSPRSPRQSPNQIPVIPPTTVPEFQSSPATSYQKTNSYSATKFTNSEPVYEPPYNAERTSSLQLPTWPSPSPKQNAGYDNPQTEPVLLKKKRFVVGTNKDTPILRNVLGHNQHNSTQPSPPPSQTIPLNQKFNYSYSANSSNGPIEQTDRMHGESPEEYMEDSIRSVESDKVLLRDDDNPPPYNNGRDRKHDVSTVPKPEWKRYKQYTRHDILSAIDAVRQGMSALQAARKFRVPSRTLYDKVKKLGISTQRPYRKGSYQPLSPFQNMRLTDAPESYSPEEQAGDPIGNGNGTESISGNGSETDCEKLDSETGSDVKHQVTSPSLNDDKDDSNEPHCSSKQFPPE